MDSLPAERPARLLRAGLRTCGLCQLDYPAAEIQTAETLPPEDLLVIVANNPWWRPVPSVDGICASCRGHFTEAREAARVFHPALDLGACPILPTPVRLGASFRHTGRGVTVAFLDSGFFAHPDLIEPKNRILAYVDITNPDAKKSDLELPDESSWHGMMTSVVACGNGSLSQGLYRGLASEARLVLVKCGTARRIVHDDIRRGLDWVIANARRYRIRVVNVSCGGDYEASYLTDALSQAAERATHAGILVVAAVGNLGHQPGHPVVPPASAPSVLTVGGLDDKNHILESGFEMYRSSYGPTLDGLQKPEVIAPGVWVAAPILPGTQTAAQARLLAKLSESKDADLKDVITTCQGIDPALDAARNLDPPLIRQLVKLKLKDNNVISGAYKHVDGTSFAAPIVSSIAAQMLQANPDLTPQHVKRILIKTAKRVTHLPVDPQGWGVVDAGKAVAAAEGK